MSTAKITTPSGLSTAEIGRQVGVSKVAVWKWLTGKEKTPMARVPDLARVSGIPREELLKRATPITTETFATINRWQRETFPTATLDGVLRHIEEEWIEFETAPTIVERIEEAADLIILLSCYIDQAGRRGAQPHIDDKMRRNRARRWNIQPDGTGRHV
jgi:hypothetical protein